MGYAPKPWGSTPAPKPAPTPIPPHVRETHVTVPKDRLRRAGIVAAYFAAALFLGFVCFHAGRGDFRPGPRPEPPPAPSPVTGTLWVTLVYDGDKPGTDFARLEADPALEEGINKLGGHMRKFTKDSKVLADKNLTQFADKYGVPTLIIQAEGVSKLVASACPKTAAEVVDAARRFKEGR